MTYREVIRAELSSGSQKLTFLVEGNGVSFRFLGTLDGSRQSDWWAYPSLENAEADLEKFVDEAVQKGWKLMSYTRASGGIQVELEQH